MNKRIVSLLLAVVMIFGSVASLAAEGDIIHTEYKKIYRKDNSSEQEELVNDIVNGFTVDKFFRETTDGKYVNIKEEEDAQFEALARIVQEKGLKTAEEIREYVLNNSSEMNKIMDEAKKSVPHIYIDTKDYQGATNAQLLTEKNFSTPEPGYKEGTTKITTLNLPNDASSWRIQILDKPVAPMKKDTLLEKAISYIKGRDIEVEVGKYLVLYAVDSRNSIKAYANVKITNDMINQPREEGLKLEIGIIEAGSSYAGTVIINKLDKLPEGAEKWQIVVSTTPVDKVYKGDILNGAVDYVHGEITVADENELVNMSDSFKKYVILIAADNDGKAIGYKIFEVGKDDISKAPTLLKENTNYIGPVPGSEDGTAIFSYLGKGSMPDNNMKNATKWQTKVYDEKPQIPILDSVIETNMEYKAKENLSVNVEQYLLLLATDDNGKIKGYKIFELIDNQVKGKTAPLINETNYTKPEKGSKSGTTKISTLKFDGIDGNPTKWMYLVGSNFQTPMLNKSIDGSVDYVVGNDIKITVGEDLLILATDDEGKVKAYVLFEQDKIVIKDPPPALLKEGVHYSTPVKGNTDGTTKFETLAITESIKEANVWKYLISNKPFEVPELNGVVDGTIELKANTDIGKDLKGNEYILILATDNSGKVKGYATFQLKESYIKMPNAPELKTENYSEPIPGTASGTTRIPKLSFIGLEGATQWRYKIEKKDFKTPELNSTIDRSAIYTQGANIPVSIGDCMILLAVDGSGKIKAYKMFKLEEKHIKAPNARGLMPTVNYSEPEPGSAESSTKFGFLNLDNIDGAKKWMYAIGDKSFGNVEIDSKVDKANEYSVNTNIVDVKENQYLLLLATDDGGDNVKAYREFRLNIDQIRGSNAKKLEKDKHYKISPGTLPGTSKLTDLGFWGIEGATRWKIKVLEKDLDENSKPYTNSIVKDTVFYNEGQNIKVLKNQYILLLATDTNSRTKAYVIIQVKDGEIMEYAPELEGINLDKGSAIDTVKVTGKIPGGNKAKIIVQNTAYPTPAVNQVLSDGKDYTLDKDISVIVGQYVNIFAVDNENKIKGFKSFKVISDNIQKATATITVKNSKDNIIPEGSIVIGGEKIEVKLTNAKWVEDIKTNESKRSNLFNGFKPDNQSTEWQKIVSELNTDGSGAVFVNDAKDTLTILLPEVIKYDIAEKQGVTLTIPANCIDGAKNPVKTTGDLVIMPTVKATISGDVVSKTIRNEDIVSGGSTIIIELADGSWKSDIPKDNLIGGFSIVGKSGDTEWSNITNAIEDKHIVRNSSKKITITLPKVSGFNLKTGSETIKLTIPKELVEGATSDVVATPTFTLYPDRLQVKGNVAHGKDTITMIAPDNKEVKEDSNTWTIEVTEGTLKEEITINDLIIAGLPRGLKAEAKKDNDKQIEISISGIASSSVASDQVVKIKIKGNAVTNLNSIDSDDIEVNIKTGEALNLDGVNYSLEIENSKLVLYLIGVNEKMQYSINSTNGINGTWESIPLGKTKVALGNAKPMRIFVSEKAQPKVFKEIVDLKYEETPKDVYVNNVSYSGNKCTITLGGIDKVTDYECSIDGGNTWADISNKIQLDEKSDLRIRKKAVSGIGGTLPSLPTAKLNGEFLGNVKMNVGEGKILGTTTNMEYSLDGDKFTSARNNETPVNFVKDMEVWIRERRKPENKISLGKVGQQEQFSEVELRKIVYEINKASITNTTGFNIEYRIGNAHWKDVKTNEKVEFSPGSLQFRKKGTETKLPSAPVEKTIIKSPASPPELRIDDYNKGIQYKDGDTWNEIDNKLEYKIGSSEAWTSGDKWKTNKKDIEFENTVVYVRTAATNTELPSQVKTINFTKNLSFEDVKVNVVEGYIENTTSNMEYSTNSTNGKNGNWNSCSNGKTKVELVEGMSVWIREKGKIQNNNNGKPIFEKVERQAKPTLEKVTYDISLKTISNSSEQDLEYRIGNEPWKEIDRNSNVYEVDFKLGVLQFRTKGTTDKLPSFPKEMATIKAPESAPNLEYDDVEYKIDKIGTDEGKDYEYSVNGRPWINGTVDTVFTEKDTVKVRKKAVSNKLPSQEQTIKFTPNLNLNDVKLDAGNKTILNTTTTMEYSLNSTDGLDGTWSTCTSSSTKMDIVKGSIIYIREKSKPKNKRKVNDEIVKEMVFDDDVLKNIKYDISKNTITIPEKKVGQLQYKFGSSVNWININKAIVYNVDFVAGELQFRLKGNEQNLPSKPVTKAVIVAAESAPNVVTKLDIGTADNYAPKNAIESINSKVSDWNKFEYSIDNSPWINGDSLKTEDLNRNVEVRIRKIAKKDKLASQIKTIAFKEVLNLKQFGLSTHVSPFELNGTTDRMQYRINGADWKDCTNGNTQLKKMDGSDLNDISVVNKIEIRDKNQTENIYTVYK